MNLNQIGTALTRNRQWLIPTGSFLAGFMAGTGAGASVVLWKKNRETLQSLDALTEMVEESRNHSLQLEEGFEQKVLEMAQEIIYHGTTKQYHTETEEFHPDDVKAAIQEVVKEEDERQRVSVFTTSHDEDGGDEWDWDEENKQRSSDAPYVITREEFDANEHDFRQSTLTWYEGDDVLTDEKDSIVYDVNGVVGELKFGHGSQDQSICYVRNERLRGEYEIILDHGSFQVQVLGADIEEELEHRQLKHSTPKFRRD